VGSGPNRIGQGVEFDYCCVHAVLALREAGIEALMINCNPETVSTDYDTSDKLYFEPLTFEDVMNIVEKERPEGLVLQFGGQTPLNLAIPLERAGVKILGTPAESVDIAEDRDRCNRLLKKLGIPRPEFGVARSIEEAGEIAKRLGFPVLSRPSYVLGGRAVAIAESESELRRFVVEALGVSPDHPVLIDKFLEDAVELDVDALADGTRVFVAPIMQHVEQAGVHSGDSACVVPPALGSGIVGVATAYVRRIGKELGIVGLMNIQMAVRDGKVYVLEINPRASRTIPFISKATGISLAKLATKVLLGTKLEDLGLPDQVKLPYFCVKESVFPFLKLPGADPVLGPEMKSTGEVMGIDKNLGLAYLKAQTAAGNKLPSKGCVFMSVRKAEQEKLVPIARRYFKAGFKILATNGTAKVLRRAGISCEITLKISQGRRNILDHLKSGEVDLIINIPTRGHDPTRDGYKIRRAAVELGIPYITTLTGALASIEAIEQAGEEGIYYLDALHKHAHGLVQQHG
jgi:carbamoyl-phosphate synthase large subunit